MKTSPPEIMKSAGADGEQGSFCARRHHSFISIVKAEATNIAHAAGIV
jgi:hypothetical protein